MNSTQHISVVINTYNAEEHLKVVLEAVKDFDEIIICDMESTDQTLDIARSYNCKIITFPKGNLRIVEPARQFAIDKASSPWANTFMKLFRRITAPMLLLSHEKTTSWEE